MVSGMFVYGFRNGLTPAEKQYIKYGSGNV